jgi:hypothetical protein
MLRTIVSTNSRGTCTNAGDLHQLRAGPPENRRHRALRRHTPIQAFTARPKAFPTGYQIPPHYRVRHDTIDAAGVITIRYNSRLHHIGLSKHLRGTKVTVLIDDRDIRVLHRHTGQLIRKLILDPTRDYQPRGVKCGNSPENRL